MREQELKWKKSSLIRNANAKHTTVHGNYTLWSKGAWAIISYGLPLLQIIISDSLPHPDLCSSPSPFSFFKQEKLSTNLLARAKNPHVTRHFREPEVLVLAVEPRFIVRVIVRVSLGCGTWLFVSVRIRVRKSNPNPKRWWESEVPHTLSLTLNAGIM